MGLLYMAHLTPDQRAERREQDEACFHRMNVQIKAGLPHHRCFDVVAQQMRLARHDVVAGYWRHRRREGLM